MPALCHPCLHNCLLRHEDVLGCFFPTVVSTFFTVSIWAGQLKCPRHLASSNKFFLVTSVCHVCRHSAASSKALITATGSSPFTCHAPGNAHPIQVMPFMSSCVTSGLGRELWHLCMLTEAPATMQTQMFRTLSHMCGQTWATAIESGRDIMCKSDEKPVQSRIDLVWCTSMDSLSPSPSPPVQPMGRWPKASRKPGTVTVWNK